jgi:hypothetical protein
MASALPGLTDAGLGQFPRHFLGSSDSTSSDAGTFRWRSRSRLEGSVSKNPLEELAMNGIIYLVGLVVVVLAILSFVGLR